MENKDAAEGAFTQRCDIIGLQVLLPRMQNLIWDTGIGHLHIR